MSMTTHPELPPSDADELGARPATGFWATFVITPVPRAAPRRLLGGRAAWLAGAAAVPFVGVLAIWFAIRAFPWFGPLLADSLRATIGTEAVTALEELSADVEDRMRMAAGTTAPRGLADSTPPELDALARSVPVKPAVKAFRPRDVEPMFPAVASPEDGRWQSVPVVSGNGAPLHRTLVHPDPERGYAELFVFAVDLTQAELHLAAGSVEPKRVPGPAGELDRSGQIPEGDRARVIAAFNGGFKSEHGQFGMMVGGVQLAPPRPSSCTVASDAEDRVSIGTWSNLLPQRGTFTAWRQTPACMVEGGELHQGLRGDTTNWGATIDGKTVIRRSAIGLDSEGKTLFVAISNSTTARALATGLMHVGAHHVAQLDVNFSYPKFVLYDKGEAGELTAVTAVKGFDVEKDTYVGRSSTRDFFYLTARQR